MTTVPADARDRGAGPFVTLRHVDLPTGLLVWHARDHRKGFGAHPARRPVWRSVAFNLLMACGFGIGSALFAAGAVLSLVPAGADLPSASAGEVNAVFFAGSIFFTLAAYLQLFQAANAGPHPDEVGALAPTAVPDWFGWRPRDPGWLASAVQFAGTLLFNANTFDAWRGGGGWLRQDLTIWGPDMAGSVLFLVSGYLVVIETCHRWWAWAPCSLAWWIVVVSFLGCIAFMISAVLAFVPPGGAPQHLVALSTAFTLVGSAAFLTGAVLSVPESIGARR